MKSCWQLFALGVAALLILTGCESEPPEPKAPLSSPGSPGREPGDPSLAAQRRALLETTLRTPPYDIGDERVLEALAAVPREDFCLEGNRHLAYRNTPLPIGFGQTISQPYIVAFMTEQLKPKPTDRVLEIGTGSGYQAAVLSPLVKHVYTIEIVEPLAREATERLSRLGYENITVKAGDGYRGWAEHAPFDALIVTCAPDEIPQPLIDQLKDGGRMIIPVGKIGAQQLVLLRKRGEHVEQTAILPVAFVPMTGEAENR